MPSGPTPCSFFSFDAGTFASWLSRVYPAAVSARVAGAPMFPGRPGSGDAMFWMVPARAMPADGTAPWPWPLTTSSQAHSSAADRMLVWGA
jgi:hypothetical protein